MHDQSDAQLLRAYAERGTEAAFARSYPEQQNAVETIRGRILGK